ncbi:MAG: hypothetical protein ABI625_23850, partial [bacterium]
VRRAANATPVQCGAAPGVLPTGTFTVSDVITATNSGNGSGSLVAGAAVVELQLLVNGAVADMKTVAVTLAVATTGISALTTTAATIPIGGAPPTYSATVVNPGPSLSPVVLQGWMHQGTARRAAGGTMIVVGGATPVGVLPTGTFTVAGSIVAFNTGGGSGTLVPGPATFELEMTMNGTLIQMKTLAVTLV